MITPKTLTYFSWEEITAELLEKGFSVKDLETYRRKFLGKEFNLHGEDDVPGPGAIRRYNLYYFGPSPAEMARNPEEAERAQSVFAWTDLPENQPLKKITHAIWDLLKDQVSPGAIEDVAIQL
jgi:hypothetical protein